MSGRVVWIQSYPLTFLHKVAALKTQMHILMLDSQKLLPLHQKITSHQRLRALWKKTTKNLKEKMKIKSLGVRMKRSCWHWPGEKGKLMDVDILSCWKRYTLISVWKWDSSHGNMFFKCRATANEVINQCFNQFLLRSI